ncbi:uncharacterized protein N7496_008518 [Penicillium cataractarum]|uniref:O-acyltransferase n=1 Tax=Penicillium cataractarum TaxID=2100454 RepID=A0A9W9S372_9EURO|nr:uncharacterized protein N7496_008518 [Penicillium cataractarum]KAJ5368758.1 hypothetical protein N7496_008518 [Penicillium cataractarum]
MSGPHEGEAELPRGRLARTPPSSTSTSVSSGAACEHEDRARRRSISVKLRETNQAGQYILTADDAELLQEVLRDNLLLEKSGASAKRPFLFRDLQFTRQRSAFDRQNPSFSSSQFHGFFTLFWLGVALMLVKVAANNWRTYGTPFGTTEIIELMLSRDVLVLGITDFILCWSTLFCLGLQRVILRGYLDWSGFGWVIQNLYKKRDLLKGRLKRLEGYSSHDSVSSSQSSPPSAIVSEIANLRKQNRQRSSTEFKSIHATRDTDHLLVLSETIENGTALGPAQMVSLKGLLTKEIELLFEGLHGQFSKNSQYPRNLTVGNFCEFITLPTLVYELEYPRTERIDWAYVAEKVVATFATIFVMIVVSQYWIYPVVMRTLDMKDQGLTVQQRLQEFPWVLSDLLFPFMMEYLLAFYVIWECVLNALAEITRFADRGFYADWWNSVSWDQFARDWNRPVHNFLLRHVYHSTISSFHLSRVSASLVTFFLSACVHELIMLCIFRRLRGYLLFLQMTQLPLVSLSRTRLMRGRRLMGNIFFWLGIFTGPSLLCSLYLII